MPTCQYCKAVVESIPDHYGGYQCEPCPDVAFAFGPAEPRVYEKGAELLPDSYVSGRDARRPCVVRGCKEPPYRRNRCFEHYHEIVKRQRARDNARAKAKLVGQGRVAA